jgi:hexokinase
MTDEFLSTGEPAAAPGGPRAIDQARAARLVMSGLTADTLMFAATVSETFEDDYGFGAMGSTINVLRSLSEDLATALAEIHGIDTAVTLLQHVIAHAISAADDEA